MYYTIWIQKNSNITFVLLASSAFMLRGGMKQEKKLNSPILEHIVTSVYPFYLIGLSLQVCKAWSRVRRQSIFKSAAPYYDVMSLIVSCSSMDSVLSCVRTVSNFLSIWKHFWSNLVDIAVMIKSIAW